jgi:hypothetical protein
MRLRLLRENRNVWLLTCFTIYAVFFFVFASVYYKIFKDDPRNFLVNSDIAKAQVLRLSVPLEQGLAELQSKAATYEKFKGANYKTSRLAEGNGYNVEVAGKDFYLNFDILTGASSKAPSDFETESLRNWIWSSSDEEAPDFRSSLELAGIAADAVKRGDIEDFNKNISEEVSKLERTVNDRLSRLAEIKSPTAQIWSYWDFLYFSIITQTTVGYGDILPNSTLVRMVVSTQLILGLMILTILISFTFAKREGSKH